LKVNALLFDTQVEYGSKEHFFHFMWGYILPSISLIKNQPKADETQYYFETCGPVMDELITEFMDLLNIKCTILSNEEIKYIHIKEFVPRWDLYLLRNYILGITKGDFSHISEFQKSIPLIYALLKKNFEKDFLEKIVETRNYILEAVQKTNLYSTKLQDTTAQILLIKRSESPEFYNPNGSAEIKGYGMDRRGLIDVDEFIKTRDNQIPTIAPYEPGKHSIVHQISTIHLSNGFIGIKGAEFANLLWLKSKSKVLLIIPASMKSPPVQQNLATLLDLEYTEIISEEENYPSLLKLKIEQYLL